MANTNRQMSETGCPGFYTEKVKTGKKKSVAGKVIGYLCSILRIK